MNFFITLNIKSPRMPQHQKRTCDSIFINAKMFIKMKPPITIMILFVAALSISLFILALYIQQNNVLDYQANKVYSALLKKISGLTFCLTNRTEQIGHEGIQDELKKFGYTEFINITLPLTPVLSVHGNYSHGGTISEIAGVLPYYLLFDADEHFHSVAVHTFVKDGWQPAKCSMEKCPPVDACVMMTIKKAAVPDDILPSTCNPLKYQNKNYSSIYMDFKKSNKNQRSQCLSGLQMNLDLNEDVGVKIYLNDFEKVKVRFRLHVAAYIFFVMLLSLLLYVIIKGRFLRGTSPAKILQN